MAWSQRRAGPARPQLRDRRRGRLDPHRRGPHAADHLRPGRPGRRSGTPSSPSIVAAAAARDVDYEVDEKKRTVGILERGIEQGRGLARHRQPLRVGQHPARRLPQQRDQGQGAVQARQGLRRHERRGPDRRRAHRPHARRPPLQRGHAPGHRGQGGGGDQGREPDPRHDHPAELLPPLRQALRHDRYGHDRGRRVPPDLQARRRADPDEPADDPRRTRPTSSTGPRTRSSTPSSTTSPSGTRRASRSSSAPSSVEKSEHLSHAAAQARHPARGAQRQAPRRARRTIVAQAGRKGAVTVATNMAGRGTDIMLGGNPEFLADARAARSAGLDPVETPEEYEAAWPERAASRPRRRSRPSTTRSPSSAGSTCSAPSGTSRAASTTSCAAAPAVRATRASRGSTSRSATT